MIDFKGILAAKQAPAAYLAERQRPFRSRQAAAQAFCGFPSIETVAT
jgi:hypothetical protein